LTSAASIAARLDRLPASRVVWTLVLLLSLGAYFEIYDLLMTGYVSPLLIEAGVFAEGRAAAFGLADQAAFASLTFAGLFLGTIAFASVADRLGRRVVFTWALLWYAAATAAMACQGSAVGIFVWRFVASLGLGVEMVTIDTYISELVSDRVRGRAFAFNQGVMFLAVPTVAFLAWVFAGRAPLGVDGWRWVAAFPVLGAAVVWAIRRRIPESPRWLAEHGRLDEAAAVVEALEQRVCRELSLASLPAAAVPPSPPRRTPARATFREIFRPPYGRRAAALAVFNFFQTIGFYGFGNWVPKLVSGQGVTIANSLAYSFAIALAFPIGPFLFMLFADRYERKWQIVAAAVGTALFGLLFTQQRHAAGIVATGVAITMSNNLLSYAYHAYQAEVFPTRIRARAVGFVYSFSRISTIVTSFVIAWLALHVGNVGVFAVIAVSMLIAAAAVGLFGPPTRGRPLEDICP
jgi:MFS transporter, putative metabolite:H+ symporter